jgi:hypothetical protein
MYLSEYSDAQRVQRIKARAQADKPLGVARGQAAGARTASDTLDDGSEERRSNPRFGLGSEILVRRRGGFNCKVKIGNLSVRGCEIEVVENFDVDDELVARLPRLEPLGARVCWSEAKRAGLEFTKSIHPAVLEALLTRLDGAATA